MNNFKRITKEFILPLLMQFLILIIAMFLHRTFVALGPNIMEPITISGEITKPTLGRLLYAIFAFIMFLISAVIAMKNENKVYFAFFTGIISGIFLWQMLGEDIWHFGLLENGQISYFVRLESISVLPMLVPLLIFVIYCVTKKNFNWGILCVIASFFTNWLGHYVSHGTYPIMQFFMNQSSWFNISGCIFGSLIILLSLYFVLRKSKTLKSMLLSSVLLYAGIAIVAFGFIES